MISRGEMRAAVVSAAIVVMTAPFAVEAQEMPVLQEGTSVWVTTADGREQRGSVASMSPTHLMLRIDAASQPIALADVRRIEGRDSLWNGARNGGIVGAAAFAGFGVFLSQALCESPDGCLRNDLGSLIAMAGLGAGAGMAAGLLVDYAIKGRRLLYAAPGSAIVFEVTPHVTVGSAGARISLTWSH